ncbi:hypothetical protein AB0F42_15275 [Streptomyces buecherae]
MRSATAVRTAPWLTLCSWVRAAMDRCYDAVLSGKTVNKALKKGS